MGKQKCRVWDYFKCSKKGEKVMYQCTFCNHTLSKNATRLVEHLNKCIKCPTKIKSIFGKPSKHGAVASSEISKGSQVYGSFASTSTSALLPSSVSSFIDTCNEEDQERLNELLARAIFSSGSPLSLTENRYWLEFFKKLRPSYIPSSRYQLSHNLLETEFRSIEQNVQSQISDANTVGIQCDGWSNIRNQAIINFMVTTPIPVLFKTLHTEADRHTGEFIAEELSKVIDDIGPEKVIGVVSDNAVAMEKAKNLIHAKYQHIYGYSCISHTLNLLVGDVMKINSLKNVESACKEIVKEVTGSHITLATFNKIQLQKNNATLALKLPVKTRWGSILSCIESLVACKSSLQVLMVTEEMNFSRNVKNNILDDDIFWIRLQKIILVLKPIVKWITQLEGDANFKISQVIISLNDIETEFNKYVHELPISKTEEKEITGFLMNRKKMALRPLHFAANLLDPNYRGESLTKEQHVHAMEFINTFLNNHPTLKEKKEVIFAELVNYCAKSDIWGMQYIWASLDKVNPISWWIGMCQKTELKNLAVAMLTLPPSSAATERSFSTYAFIHNARRNRLTVKRAGMLTYVAHNLKLLQESNPSSESKIKSTASEMPTVTMVTNVEKGGKKRKPKICRGKNESDSDSDDTDSVSMHETNSSIGEEDFSDLENCEDERA